ncbi:hypothetical protein OsJ_22289 [Oryza sativa Japonica Group]|uniref:Uncharacterized protein n=1 Tax=Oryza sativa subsp. japonica TaxID=39947 RepID=A3BEF0_ORYSJ|nr:hypothetical protein OsJ_22289 [Oryza sativa Japonica Group]
MGSALFSTIATSVESLRVTGANADVDGVAAEKKPPRNDRKRKRNKGASGRTYEETRARYPLLVEAVEALAAAGELGLPPPPHVRGHRLLLERVSEDDARPARAQAEGGRAREGEVRASPAAAHRVVEGGAGQGRGERRSLRRYRRRKTTTTTTPTATARGGGKRRRQRRRRSAGAGRRQYEEMRDRYPLLVAEVEALAAAGELALPPHVPGLRRLVELVGGCDARRLEDMLKNDALMKVVTNLQRRRLTVNLMSALIKTEEKHK